MGIAQAPLGTEMPIISIGVRCLTTTVNKCNILSASSLPDLNLHLVHALNWRGRVLNLELANGEA